MFRITIGRTAITVRRETTTGPFTAQLFRSDINYVSKPIPIQSLEHLFDFVARVTRTDAIP